MYGTVAGTSTTGWVIGFTIGIVIVLVVVALVVPILLLARSIGNEAPKINDALTQAVHNTAPLGALRTTIEHATIIIGGLQRGAPGWEVSDGRSGHVLDHAQPVADREHRRPGRGGRGGGPAEPAHLLREGHRPPGRRRAGHA